MKSSSSPPPKTSSRIRGELARLPRWLWLALAGVFVSALALGFGFSSMAKSQAQERAAARGLELQVGSVRPGWWAVTLHDVELRQKGSNAIRARLDELRVELSAGLGVEAVRVRGGEVLLEGTPSALQAAVRKIQGGGSTDSTAGAGPGREYTALGLTVRWLGLDPAGQEQRALGVSATKQGNRFEFALAGLELRVQAGSLMATDVKGLVERIESTLAISSIQVAKLQGELRLETERSEPTDSMTQTAGVVDTQPSDDQPSDDQPSDDQPSDDQPSDDQPSDGQPSDGKEGRSAAKPPPLAALSAPKTSPWPRIRSLLDRSQQLLDQRLRPGARVDVEQLQLKLLRGESSLNLGPAPLRVQREGQRIKGSFTPPAQNEAARISAQASIPLSSGDFEFTFSGGPVDLQTLGVRSGDFGLLGVDRTRLKLSTQVVLSEKGNLQVEASGQLAELQIEHPGLGPEPLTGMNWSWAGSAQLDLANRKLSLRGGRIGIEDVELQLSGEVSAHGEDLDVSVQALMEETNCQSLFEAAPRALLPQLEGLRLGGTLALKTGLQVDTAQPEKAEVTWRLDNECKVFEVPEPVDPRRFREPFEHIVLDEDGRAREVLTGPTTESWVPLEEISPAMETALVVCEDSRFFRHGGFDNKAIRDSIASNLKAGHFVRGASTLTMQLAKNLYLGREKTMSRKLQEAVFTLLLEERLNKEDILELYLNVVEFGPGIYGIRQAAAHYFSSHPGELSLGQALYLGSILPSPKARHFEEDGSLSERWTEHLRYLMKIAHKIKRISDEELAAGLAEELRFGQPHQPPEGDFLFSTGELDLNDG